MVSLVKSETEKSLDSFEKRLKKLEEAVFNQKTKSDNRTKKYKGLVGGINFLIDNGFFNKLRTANEVHAELKKEGYYHRLQAVDTTLRRDFVGKKKILARDQENGVWKYALRK